MNPIYKLVGRVNQIMYRIKYNVGLFLVGYPYGLLGKIYRVEDYNDGKYTLWDRARYRLLVGESLGRAETEKGGTV